ncbi:PAS domain S-box protein [Oleiphilus messinensis]|nr:PAS domain S-box protein [Oleiphilus messinensis]
MNDLVKQTKTLRLFRLCVILIGLVVSILIYWFVDQSQRQQAYTEMRLVTQQRALALTDRTSSRLASLQTLRSQIEHSGNLSPAAFKNQAEILLAFFPEIESIEWAPKIKSGSLDSFERRLQQTQAKTTQLTLSDSESSGIAFHLPIEYQHRHKHLPLQHPPGFDLIREAQWRDAIRSAIDRNMITSTRRYLAFAEDHPTDLIRLFLPVFQADTSQNQLRGLLSLELNVKRFIEQATQSNLAQAVPFEVYDNEDHNKIPLYHWPPAEIFSGLDSPLEHKTVVLPFADHEWTLVNVATPAFIQKYQNRLPIWLFVASLLCTIAVYVIVRITQSLAERLHEESNDRCWQLEQSNKALSNKMIEKGTFENALRESQDRLHDFIRISDDYFWELDTNHHFTYVSKQIVQFTGFPPTAMIGSSFLDMLHEEDSNSFRQALEKAIPKKRKIAIELRCKGHHNHWRWEKINVRPMFSTEGHCIGFRGISQDITDTKDELELLPETEPLLANESYGSAQQAINSVADQITSDRRFAQKLENFIHRHKATLDKTREAFFREALPEVAHELAALHEDAAEIGADKISELAGELKESHYKQAHREEQERLIEQLESHLEPMMDNINQSLHRQNPGSAGQKQA